MKEFFIEDDRIRLHAKLDMPENAEKCPLLIIVHGLTGDMEEHHLVAIRKTANEIGFAALRVEMYGHGQSEGDFADHTLFKWISNIMRVTDYARNLPFVTDIYLAGHSQGGLLTILAAGMRPDAYKAIIPMSAALVIPEGARNGKMLACFDPDHIPDELEIWGHPLKGDYFRCAQMIHAEDAIRRYTRPVLLVHGEKDEAVPVRYSIDAAKMYADSRLVITPEDDHGFHTNLPLACDAVREFLLKMEG